MATPLTPEQRSLRARAAAHRSWARTPDRRARTEAASKAFLARFEDQVDPDRTLPADIRQKMAESARKAYYTDLAYKSARARGARKAVPDDAA